MVTPNDKRLLRKIEENFSLAFRSSDLLQETCDDWEEYQLAKGFDPNWMEKFMLKDMVTRLEESVRVLRRQIYSIGTS